MEKKIDQILTLRQFCKDEIELLQSELELFLKECDDQNNVLINTTCNTETLCLLDHYMTNLTNVLNMTRKFNLYFQINSSSKSEISRIQFYKNGYQNYTDMCLHNGCWDNNSGAVCINGFINKVQNCTETSRDSLNCSPSESTNVKLRETALSCSTLVPDEHGYAVKVPSKNKTDIDMQCILNLELPKKNYEKFVEGYEFEASITHVKDYKNLIFYICDVNDHNTLFELHKMENMEKIDGKQLHEHPLFCVTKNVTVFDKEKHVIFWRAIINSKDNQTVNDNDLYLIDYGETVPLRNYCSHTFYKLPREYQNIPPLAIKCVLEGVLCANNSIETRKSFLEIMLEKSEYKTVVFRVMRCVGSTLHLILLKSEEEKSQSQINNFKTKEIQYVNTSNRFEHKSNSSVLENSDIRISEPLKSYGVCVNDVFFSGQKGEILKIIVTYIETPTTVYGVTDCHSLFWTDTEVNIKQRQFSPETKPKINELVLCHYIKDRYWYRSKILKFNQAKQMYKVYYIDYGNVEDVPLSCLAKCTKDQSKSAPLAIRFRLANVPQDIDIKYKFNERNVEYEKVMKAMEVMMLHKALQIKVIDITDEEVIVRLIDPQYVDLINTLFCMDIKR